MSKTNFRFRWRVAGEEHEAIIAAASHAEACFLLGVKHATWLFLEGRNLVGATRIAPDFEMDLSKPDIVE